MTELILNKKVVKNKLVLLGDVFVGKTALAHRFSCNEFKEYTQSTLGAQFITHSIEMDNCTMQFDIWDTAGQERFKSQGALYYKNSKGALVVFDVTSERSFIKAKSWIDELMENADPDILITLVGNKIDIESGRKVQKSEAEDYCKATGQLYYETSAKTGLGVTEAFTGMMKKIPVKNSFDDAEDGIDLNSKKKEENNSGLGCSC